MSISREDRAYLFGTENVQEQIKLFLFSQPGKRCKESDLARVFYDISSGLRLSSIIALETRGMIERKDDLIILIEENAGINGQMSDKLWKAARFEKVFIAKTLNEYVPEATDNFIRKLLRTWLSLGAIEVIGRTPGKNARIFRLVNDTPIRPKKKRSQGSDVVEGIWEAVQSFDGRFRKSDVIEKLERVPSKAYIDELFARWVKEGLIERLPDSEKIGHAYTYRRTSSQGERPVVVNRQRMRRRNTNG